MIDALIQGRIYGQPAQRTSKAGKPFAVCKVRVAISAEESIFVSCIAFDADPVNALLALSDKDSVSLAGALTPKVWTDRDGNAKPSLDMMVHAVLTPYHVTRKRKAFAKDDSHDARPATYNAPRKPLDGNDFPDDDLNF